MRSGLIFHEDLIGCKIDNYKILSIIGKGGMGTVFKAYDVHLERIVALKVMSEGIVKTERFVRKFKQEAKNHAKLIHTNIAIVHGFLDYKDLLGIVMEFVEGESLEHRLMLRGRLEIKEAIGITHQLLSALIYAHSKGFVHKDIKPSNIILGNDGIVKLLDFGISISVTNTNVTATSPAGTIFYMSPEQITGGDIDFRSDIYSLGCTLYEMITGKVPFYSENNFSVMEGHIKIFPTHASVYRNEIPFMLDSIIQKTLEKNKSTRYQSCKELVDDLRRVNFQDVFVVPTASIKGNYKIGSRQEKPAPTLDENDAPKSSSRLKGFVVTVVSLVLLILLAYYAVYMVKDMELKKNEKIDQQKPKEKDGEMHTIDQYIK